MKLRNLLALTAGGILSLALLLQIGSIVPRRGSSRPQPGSQVGPQPDSQSGLQARCQYRVCAARFGIHTNIIVPVANSAFNWQDYLSLPLTREQYLGFGWGERDWYLNPPPDGSIDFYLRGVLSLLLPDSAALRVQRHDRFPSQYEIRCVGVDRSDYLALMEYIQRSFQRDATGRTLQISQDPAAGKAFYEATGRYFFFHNSNHWTADGLRAAGINTPLWAGFSEAVMRQIEPTCPGDAA